MIPKDTVDAIMQATVIEEVVGEFVQLKKSGTSMRGLSPFTNEKTPSFYVVPGKGIFKDFSSGKGGSAITFLMEHEKLSYPEALRWLASKYGIEIQERELTAEEQAEQTERESLANLATWAQKWFSEQLNETGEGKSVGLGYMRQRGFGDAMLSDFAIGYCPDSPWSEEGALAKAAKKAGYQEKWLLSSGLCKKREDGTLYDFYRGRVIFPIRDVTGRFIGFGGRTLKTDKKAPKYVNSPESPLYNKSRALYGIHLARNAVVKSDRAILVEGYTDVMAMRQAGVEHVGQQDQKGGTSAEGNTPDRSIAVSGSRASGFSQNDVAWIQGLKGESLQSLAQKFQVTVWQLRKYNDLDGAEGSTVLQQDCKLYTQPKRRRGVRHWHVVQEGESLRSISDLEAVKLKVLIQRTGKSADQVLPVGFKVPLRFPPREDGTLPWYARIGGSG